MLHPDFISEHRPGVGTGQLGKTDKAEEKRELYPFKTLTLQTIALCGYTSNVQHCKGLTHHFLISDIRALWRSVLMHGQCETLDIRWKIEDFVR